MDCNLFSPRCSKCDKKMTGPAPHLKFSHLNKDDCTTSMFWTFTDDGGVFRSDWKYCNKMDTWTCSDCRTYSICEQMCVCCSPLCFETDTFTTTYFVWNKPIERERQAEYPFMFVDKYRDIDGYRAVLCKMRLKFIQQNAFEELWKLSYTLKGNVTKYEISYFRFMVVKIASLGTYFRVLITAKWIKLFIHRVHSMFEQLEDLSVGTAVVILNAVCNDTCVPVTEEEYMEFRLLHTTNELDGLTAEEAVYQHGQSIEQTFWQHNRTNTFDLDYYPRQLIGEKAKYCNDDYVINEIAQRSTTPGARLSRCLHVDPRIPVTWRIAFLRETLDAKRKQAKNLAILNKNGHLKIWQVLRNVDGLLLTYSVPLGFDFDNSAMYIDYAFDTTELVITLTDGALCNSLIPGREIMDNHTAYVEKGEFDVLHISGIHCPFHPAIIAKGDHKMFVTTVDQILQKERGMDVDIDVPLDWSSDSNISTFLENKLSRGIAFWEGFTHNKIVK